MKLRKVHLGTLILLSSSATSSLISCIHEEGDLYGPSPREEEEMRVYYGPAPREVIIDPEWEESAEPADSASYINIREDND